jgi:hypothetical protein
MNRKFFNVIGLLCGIIGVIFIFIYGPPQPSFDTGIGLGIEGPEVAKHDAGILALRHEYEVWSRVGLGFILVGFVFQFTAEMLTETEIKRLRQNGEKNNPQNG